MRTKSLKEKFHYVLAKRHCWQDRYVLARRIGGKRLEAAIHLHRAASSRTSKSKMVLDISRAEQLLGGIVHPDPPAYTAWGLMVMASRWRNQLLEENESGT